MSITPQTTAALVNVERYLKEINYPQRMNDGRYSMPWW